MRLLKSVPKNREFYNEHGRNLKAFATIANIGQLLSAASLALAVFSILRDAIAGRGMTVATGGIIAAAVLIGLFIELANRQLARPALRPFVVKDQFADDPVRQHRHKLLTRFSRAGLLVVGALSFGLSFVGSMDAGQLITDAPPPANVDSLQTVFAADTAALLMPLRVRADAARQQFTATEANRQKAAQDYDGCANKGNKWCKKKRRNILGEIDAARAVLAVTLADIATERGRLTGEAFASRDATLKEIRTEATAAAAESEAAAASNGYIFAVLTATGQIIFYLMQFLILHITAGSEIGEELQPNEFDNQPSVVSDLRTVVSHRTERGARRLIRKIFGDRDRLEGGLPYVTAWSQPDAPPPSDPTTAPTESTHHAPGFYQSADDPHTPAARAPFIAHGTHGTHTAPTHTKRTHESTESREAKQRLKQYKKRLGEHTQKAKAQQRKDGQIKPRTAEAIANNQQWVSHYEDVLKSMSNG